MVIKLCPTCNTIVGGHHRVYCSEQCQHIAEAQRRRNACPNCGNLKQKVSQYCRKCYGQFLRGEKHYAWKGGRILRQGYVLIWQPNHPRADANGYVREHILVWEQTHNKPLPKGWTIHHLNGIKSDNRHVNLIALPNRKHYLVLQAKAKRIQELEGLLNNQHQLF